MRSIVASTNCRDAISTDGYTSSGGYWNQAYYARFEKANPYRIFREAGRLLIDMSTR
jgi:hypothetical protein